MITRITRREFVRRGTFVAGVIPALRWRAGLRAPETLRVGIVESQSAARGAFKDSDRWLGLQLGVDEAKHGAQLFGGAIEVTVLSSGTVRESVLSAIIGGGDTDACVSWTERAAKVGAVFVNVGCASDELRGAKCNRAAFHVAPSEAMYRDARAMLGDANALEVTAWDPSLSRFGADTLNQRFRTRFDRPMSADAWTSWMAVKILWESSLRAKSVAGDAIARYLVRDTTRFDGHKGQPLSFRAWDHQLRQPLYLVTAGENGTRKTREAPDGPPSDASRSSLDRLGDGPDGSACKFGQ